MAVLISKRLNYWCRPKEDLCFDTAGLVNFFAHGLEFQLYTLAQSAAVADFRKAMEKDLFADGWGSTFIYVFAL